MKASLIFHGKEQNLVMHPDKPSPSTAIFALFAIIALYTGRKEYMMGIMYSFEWCYCLNVDNKECSKEGVKPISTV